MVIKVLDKKTKLEKELKQATSGDLINHTCEKCGRQRTSFYRRNRINKILNFYCLSCDNSDTIKKAWSNKIRQTNLNRYGVDSFSKTKSFIQKTKQSFIKRYGVDNPAKSRDIKEKTKQTCFKKYGVEYTSQTENNKSKSKITCRKRYGVDYSFQSDNNKKKSKKTCLDKYGVEYITQLYSIKEKIKKTVLDKYVVDNYTKTAEYKEYMKTIHDDWIKNINATKLRNNSFNTSKVEDDAFFLLKQKNINVIRNYKEQRYPFNCDFYVPEKDLFIECNFHWTHGKEPFDKNNQLHLDKIKKWENLTYKCPFYKVAIKTWTERDVKKRNLAKNNNLNYLELFYFRDFKSWLENERN